MNDITAVILTFNEAPNIARTLEKLSWLPQVIVVDSCSTDGTVPIAEGFPNTRVVRRAFTTHAEQWGFAVGETGITTDWVLALDADYVLTDALVTEIQALPSSAAAGFAASFDYCIDGRPLARRRVSAGHRPVSTVARALRARRAHAAGADRRRGAAAVGRIHHDDRKPLGHWLAAQARYMALEAEKLGSAALARRRRSLAEMAGDRAAGDVLSTATSCAAAFSTAGRACTTRFSARRRS